MEAAAASTEIWVLGWSVVLLLTQIVLPSATASDLSFPYLSGPRDEEQRTTSVVSQRLARALNNFRETYPAFIALALALAVTGKTGGIAATGAVLWLVCRIVYVAVYATGVPMIRSIIWFGSILGLVMMLVRLLA